MQALHNWRNERSKSQLDSSRVTGIRNGISALPKDSLRGCSKSETRCIFLLVMPLLSRANRVGAELGQCRNYPSTGSALGSSIISVFGIPT